MSEWTQVSKIDNTKPELDPAGGHDVAFISPDRKTTEIWLICHACDKTHKDGWEKGNQTTKKIRAQIRQLAKAGTFEDKNTSSSGDIGTPKASKVGRPTKHKKGTPNAIVNKEDSNKETESKDDGLSNQDHIL